MSQSTPCTIILHNENTDCKSYLFEWLSMSEALAREGFRECPDVRQLERKRNLKPICITASTLLNKAKCFRIGRYKAVFRPQSPFSAPIGQIRVCPHLVGKPLATGTGQWYTHRPWPSLRRVRHRDPGRESGAIRRLRRTRCHRPSGRVHLGAHAAGKQKLK